jgi:hypothetical protein
MGVSWRITEDGCIGQTLADLQDPSIRLFTQTAALHNQAIRDEKAK